MFLSHKGFLERGRDQDEGREGVLDEKVEAVAHSDGAGVVDVEKIFVFGLGISLGVSPAFKSCWKGGESVDVTL
jgi:hypothetical protein